MICYDLLCRFRRFKGLECFKDVVSYFVNSDGLQVEKYAF